MINEISDFVGKMLPEKKQWQAGKDLVHYSGPYFGQEEYVAAISSLLNGWLVMGDKSIEFERKFPEHFGKKYGALTNSGSSANLLMMSALTSKRWHNLQKGTKVITPVAGFPTTVNPILQTGMQPVFVDIELDTLNLNLNEVERALRNDPSIRVLTFAHVLGNPPDMDRVMHLVKKYDLILLEDCCDALGSTFDGEPLGSFGTMASCSFYPAHHMTMGEGGFVACAEKSQETIVRSFREWGRGCYCVGPDANKLQCGTCGKRFSEWIPDMKGEVFDHKYVYDEIGYNLKPIELQSAIGLVQMERLSEIRRIRNENFDLLMKKYQKYEEFFHLPKSHHLASPSWFAFPLTIRTTAPFVRSDLVQYFEDNMIQTRPYFAGNLLLQPAYRHLGKNASDVYPIATLTMLNTFFHGTSPVITPEMIDYIGEKLDDFMSLVV